ncbi:PREDICTED: uncharacterized protein LOC104602373 [Nelumbo nucifera]|uniref:Uncharacterized protein LOC104602373 n=2 Tax=Nelumbo nucifera TaxID=4432 RepID=A0A1U8ABZ0_NELNU|nr:PREDICTED: uncharacterized protein LOC104602373 [Nelumbo nucifera]XP_010264352.1 PREDICTED: uncharacterized protein LOC104602373 [Nelumbo nucifera]XP_010264361.1 PREDICTED: uncharacterized protein LOC104602373 [Nelumbo nucifera]XP_010264370.1 PREDICTED: uncharacterized protein LOC104602373 [Nelumbo nucifera]DAD35388.1 TPA_asm: hypothetical protein HUJ06_006028 [Nelumbo nucifera]
MVTSRVSEGERSQEFTFMARENSRPLHNFSLPYLKWGKQRRLRCVRVIPDGETPSLGRRSPASDVEVERFVDEKKQRESLKRGYSKGSGSFMKWQLPPIGVSGGMSKMERGGEDRIEALRINIDFHLLEVAHKKDLTAKDDAEEDEPSSSAAAARPWNLRTRRDACKAPNETGGVLKNEEKQQNSSPTRAENSTMKSLRSRGLASTQCVEKKEREKFSISLSREEIEEDFVGITGTRPHRRPKKRARNIQKLLDATLPGLWLTEITPDTYKVPDFPEPGKM